MAKVMVPGRLFAALYDRSLQRVEERGGRELRARLLAGAAGDVVELGAGTGLNLEHYPPAVHRLVLTEPDRHMRAKLEEKTRRLGRAAEVVDAGADALPFPDASFDCAVSTLVLCTVDDVRATLAEVARVLRPGGRLLLLEHVRGDGRLGSVQTAVKPVWKVAARGCRPDRDTLDAVRTARFAVESVEHLELPEMPPIVRPAVLAVARRPG